MAVEVIDLVSSPNIGVARPLVSPPTRAVSGGQLAAEKLDYNADHPRTARFQNKQHSKPLLKASARDHAWLLDDDFDTSAGVYNDTHVAERPRLSERPLKALLSLDDDTDPFAKTPPGAKASHRQVTAAKSDAVVPDDDVDVNPFLSSSPPRAERSTNIAARWDPISSSAPQERKRLSLPGFRKSRSEVVIIEDDSDDSLMASNDLLSSDDEFPEVGKLDFDRPALDPLPLKRKTSSPRTKTTKSVRKPASSAKSAITAAEKIEEKAKKAAERGAEKERKKAEREAAKQEKTMEKERKAALDEVNKLKTDKRKSALEMIVSLPNSLEPKTLARADALLEALHVQFDRWTSPVKNVVTWRRKVKARYVEESDQWEPIPQRIVQERIAMVILPAAEFVQLALGHGSQEEAASGIGDLDTHVDHMRQHFPEHTIIYLIEGLRLWVRNNNNVRNRKFVAAVRNGLDPNSAVNSAASTQPANAPPASSQSRPRQRKKVAPPSEFISEDVIEDALLSLQVLHGARIHHTANHAETAEWVTVFTQHIGTIPYRRQREAISAQGNFCMESGQVRTGDGARDTYVRMLQEVARVTASVAYGIAAEFETVSALVRGLEAEGPLRLQMIRKSANRDGSVTDQRIGPAISKRLHKIFTGRDVDSMDI